MTTSFILMSNGQVVKETKTSRLTLYKSDERLGSRPLVRIRIDEQSLLETVNSEPKRVNVNRV